MSEVTRAQRTNMSTASGMPIYYLEPFRTPILESDLIIHLSRVCRYGGALRWSVLEHTALCVELAKAHKVDPEALPYIAAHDLHEAYVGDLPTSLKQVLPEFKEYVENPWEHRVHTHLGLTWPVPTRIEEIVKRIDHLALIVEMVQLQHPKARDAMAQELGAEDMAAWYRVNDAADAQDGAFQCWLLIKDVLRVV